MSITTPQTAIFAIVKCASDDYSRLCSMKPIFDESIRLEVILLPDKLLLVKFQVRIECRPSPLCSHLEFSPNASY